jgi:hypothetical protein
MVCSGMVGRGPLGPALGSRAQSDRSTAAKPPLCPSRQQLLPHGLLFGDALLVITKA